MIAVGVALKIYGLEFGNLARLVEIVFQPSLHVIGFCLLLVVTKCVATFRQRRIVVGRDQKTCPDLQR